MGKRRVLLLCAQPLLGESLENILSQMEDVELIIVPLSPDAQAFARLSREKPEVVLIAEEEGEVEDVASLTAQILESYPGLPIIRIRFTQNVIRLYTSRTLPARSADLIEAIRNLSAHQHGCEADNRKSV